MRFELSNQSFLHLNPSFSLLYIFFVEVLITSNCIYLRTTLALDSLVAARTS